MTQFNKILVALDFSSVSEKLLEKAVMLKANSDAKIVAVHIIDYAPPSYVSVEIPEIYTSESLMKERAQKNMQDMISKLEGEEVEIIVRVGKTKHLLVSIVEEIGADLAIFGKHDPEGIEKYLGSTTHAAVNNAGCDLLVAHG